MRKKGQITGDVMKRLAWLVASLVLLLLPGCAVKTEVVDIAKDHGPAILALDYRDFDGAATQMVGSMLRSKAVNKPGGGRYVLAIAHVDNETMQRIDTDQLVKKIRVDLLNSGRVVTTTATGGAGPEDRMSYQVRELRHSAEFDQRRIPGERQLQAPDLSLSGKIRQVNHRVDRKRQKIEYYFQLTLTDLATGDAIWEEEKLIVKQGSSKLVPW